MSERKLAGEAHHDVPGLAGISKIENDDEDREQIVVGKPRRGQQHREQRGEQTHRPARQTIGEARDHRIHHVGLLPRMPCGRNNSTSTRMPKANMLLADGVNSKPASASVSPISPPPISAPGIEPSPPVMTMTKARKG